MNLSRCTKDLLTNIVGSRGGPTGGTGGTLQEPRENSSDQHK